MVSELNNRRYYHEDFSVLILVLMETTNGSSCNVVVQYGLWDSCLQSDERGMQVLILVLMETTNGSLCNAVEQYGLWEDVKLNINEMFLPS